MNIFLSILIGIIIFDIIFMLIILCAPKANKPITKEEYGEFKEFIKTYEGNHSRRRKRNKTSPNN
jgi:hypothetical protein